MPTGTKTTSVTLIKELERLGYDFKLNLMNDTLEVCGEPITDPLRSKIRMQLRDLGYKRHLTAAEDAYLAHAYDNAYHPIQDYLENLTWDNSPNIRRLSTYFTDDHDPQCSGNNVFYTFFNRWLIGSVAKSLDYKQNSMLVLDGPQGIGKSHFVRWLASGVSPQFFL